MDSGRQAESLRTLDFFPPRSLASRRVVLTVLASAAALAFLVATAEVSRYGPPELGGMELRFPPILGGLLAMVGFAWIGAALRGARARRDPEPNPASPRRADHAAPPVLVARSGRTLRLVELGTIDWIEASGRYAQVHAQGAHHLLDEPLARLAERLPAADFVRVHRSAIVRVDRVFSLRSVDGRDFEISLKSGAVVRMSRTYRSRLEGALGVHLKASR